MAHASPCSTSCTLQANNTQLGDLRWVASLSSSSSLCLVRQCPAGVCHWSPNRTVQRIRATPAVTLVTGHSRIARLFAPKSRGYSSQPLDNQFNVSYKMPFRTSHHFSHPHTLSSVTRATSSRSLHNHPILEPARRGENRGEMSYQVEAVLSNLMSLPPRGSMARCMDSFKGKISMQASRAGTVLMKFLMRERMRVHALEHQHHQRIVTMLPLLCATMHLPCRSIDLSQ